MIRNPLSTRSRSSGFTLIELMVVLVILGLLASIVTLKVVGQTDKARVTKAKVEVQKLGQALNMYKLDNFVYPSTQQGLQALVHRPSGDPPAPNWQSGGYVNRLPIDPWGHPYQYLNPGTHGGDYDLFSLGPTGKPGGTGENAEIGNWNLGN